MGLGISFSGRLAALYADLLDKTLERWQIALTEARAGTYTADHAATDAVLQWHDYLRFMTFPGEAFTTTQAFVVTLNFSGSAVSAESAPIPFPAFPFLPEPSDLARVGGGGLIPKDKITVSFDATLRTLKLQLTGLSGSLLAGQYTGDLHQPTDPSNVVANVLATVS